MDMNTRLLFHRAFYEIYRVSIVIAMFEDTSCPIHRIATVCHKLRHGTSDKLQKGNVTLKSINTWQFYFGADVRM